VILFQPTHPHGVRRLRQPKCGLSYMFQPTHPHGVRHLVFIRQQPTVEFQPTHPHGVRQKELGKPFSPDRFNPRTRTGCDDV